MPIYDNAAYVAPRTTYYYYFQNATDPGIGYVWLLTPQGEPSVLNALNEGVARPAWYPAWTPDSSNSLSPQSGGSPARNYNSMNASGDYADWNVPSDGNGADTLVINVIGLTTAGVMDVVKNPGASEVTLGEVTCTNGSTDYGLVRTVTLSESLSTGDVLRFRWKSGNAANTAMASFYAYDSDGVCTTYDRPFTLTGLVSVNGTAAGTWEYAYNIGPVGETPKWTGGYDHQSNTGGCTETSITETWTRNGEAWTQAVGWKSGEITRRRQATIDWSGAGVNVATIDYTLTFGSTRFGCANTLVALADLDIGSLYPGMARWSHSMGVAQFTPAGSLFSTTPADDTTVSASTAELVPNTGVIAGVTPLGAQLLFTMSNQSHAAYSAFVLMAANAAKYYRRILPAATLAGATWGGEWTAQFTKSARYRKWKHNPASLTSVLS